MRRPILVALVGLCVAFTGEYIFAAEPAAPLALHPENPHYFLWRGKPALLVGSGEHYGAVLNGEFDFVKYLNELAACKLNHTRTFTGVYCEPPGAFNISKNTLSPASGQLLAPWARSEKPGYANGGNKFDLTKWDDAYFKRLKEFVTQASQRGVVVEVCLFCPFYEEGQWKLSPQNAANNVNSLGEVSRTNVYTLDKHGGLLAVHEALVRKMARELAECDNIYFEICNEPYFGGVTKAWQERMVEVLVAAEKELPRPHLISLNIANVRQKVEQPPAAVSVFNFHYCAPPDTVAENFALARPIGDNETGFKGTGDVAYRREAWEFLLAGGALFSHLDYSFAVGHEDGTFAYPGTQPGGGSHGFREQMRTLHAFLTEFSFVRMQPNQSVLLTPAAKQGSIRVLAEVGEQYAVYVFGGQLTELALELPAGKYAYVGLHPSSGKAEPAATFDHAGGRATLKLPRYATDLALAVRRAR